MTKGWLYNPITTNQPTGERRQRPKPGVSKPITAKPDHKIEEVSDDKRVEKVLNIRVQEGETEKRKKCS